MHCAGTTTIRQRIARGWIFLVRVAIIVMAAGLALLAGPSSRAQVATGPDQGIAGYWDWGAGAPGNIVTIWGNGTGRGGEGNALTWTLVDQIARQYRLQWSNGFTDMATLSVDGSKLLVVNNQGVRFVSTRHPGTSSANPNPPPPTPGGAQPGGAVAGGPLPTGANQGIAGEWDWGAGGGGNVVVIWGNGTGRDSAGHTMQWQLLDPVTRRYRLTWSHGFVDEGELTVDGQKILLVNNVGTRFIGTRRAASSGAGDVAGGPTPPPPPPPAAGGTEPDGGSAGGPLPAGRDSFDLTSILHGDPFNGGEWANANGGLATAQRYMMPPVCINGFSLESAGSDMSTRGATIRIELIDPYGGRFSALDLRGVAVNRGFSPGGSGKVVPPQSATFRPFRTSRIEVEMRGHGWFLMKGLRFSVVRCP